MKDQALQVGRGPGTDRERRNRLREYLQHVLLRALFDQRLLGELVFHGGTALRMLHDLARFSEDLDFHTTDAERDAAASADTTEQSRFDLEDHLEGVVAKLESAGYRVDTRARTGGNVQSCMFRFPQLLYECGLSPRAAEKLSIKLEIDRNPPQGFTVERSAIDEYFPVVVVHHDRPTFLAGKLHALLQRPYAKGRDYYDLMFYLRRWPDVAPNLGYLNAALRQTGYGGDAVTAASWKERVAARVREVDWAAVKRDLAPFVLRSGDLEAFEQEFLLRML